MSNVPSLYRRHRPRRFADVVGQQHVVRTLRNALEQGKVHHAYLFVGSRGTGKTSLAKILAAALNCSGSPEGTAEPCASCPSCLSIAAGNSLDVIEMDAASNNSVDDIRDLREKVAYAPAAGRYKVYILDEAHMLTTAAWNAFLKTLEEPPPNTVFVLATTEANKVLPTVVDRCHRFDFVRPSVSEISTVLARVCEEEQIALPEEACALVARAATGSFRDALGTVEQLVTYSGPSIALPDVLAVLGIADSDSLFSAIDFVTARDARGVLGLIDQLASAGRDIERFFSDLEGHLRALMVVQTLGGEVPAELRITPELDARLAAQAETVAAGDVFGLLDLLAGALRAIKDGADARTQLELMFLKMTVGGTPVIRPYAPKAAAADVEQAVVVSETTPVAQSTFAPPTPVPVAPLTPAPTQSMPFTPPGESQVFLPPVVQPPVATTAQPAQHPPVAPPPPASSPVAAHSPVAPAPAACPTTPMEAPPPPPHTPPAPPVSPELASFSASWAAILEQVQKTSPLLAALLRDSQPVSVADRTLTLAWPESAAFLKRKAEDKTNNELIVRAIEETTGTRLRIEYELRPDGEITAGPILSEDEIIARLVSEFDAQEVPPGTEITEAPHPQETQV